MPGGFVGPPGWWAQEAAALRFFGGQFSCTCASARVRSPGGRLHALFRQNYGCSHLVVGRDHAGVGKYYGPFDAHHIFDHVPKGTLQIRPLKIDVAFWCYKCGGMASGRTCPHGDGDRLQVSGTQLRQWMSEGAPVPAEFSRPEVVDVLREYYADIDAPKNAPAKPASHSPG